MYRDDSNDEKAEKTKPVTKFKTTPKAVIASTKVDAITALCNLLGGAGSQEVYTTTQSQKAMTSLDPCSLRTSGIKGGLH